MGWSPCAANMVSGRAYYLTRDPSAEKMIIGENYWIINGQKVPDGPTTGADANYRAMMAMQDAKDANYGAVPSSSAQDNLAGQQQQLEKTGNADLGPLYPSRVHFVKVGNPNFYAYVNQNPWSAFDPDGLDAVLLNDSTGALKEGHNATVVGNDKSGWTYYSKGGYGTGNTRATFKTLQDFENSPLAKRYNHQDRVTTSSGQDFRMKSYGDEHYNDAYAWCEAPFKPGENCADLSADILNAGDVKTTKPKKMAYGLLGPLTGPNEQYGQFTKDHPAPQKTTEPNTSTSSQPANPSP